ncbi:DUF4232 domain-containing protein [Streptomyces sp. NPDC004647]|uniref:DUF4232 domain-containing protein n=1 Tax=Streptomyces sp. NPDC004647 TaxID=3154671 RepID=UPI0033AFC77D
MPSTATATAGRSRSLRLAAACLTAAAALTLTACGGESATGVRTSGEPTNGPAAKDSGAKDSEGSAEQQSGGTGTSAKATGNSGTANGGTANGGSARPGAAKGPTCAPKNVKVELQAVKRPVNHMLVTATNTSRTTCTAYAFPYVTFDGDKAGLDAQEESKPQAVTTIAPGKSAYAGIALSSADGSGAGGREVSEAGIAFAEVDPSGDPGRPVTLPVPGGSAHVDDSAKVTYWVNSVDDALTW